MRHTLSIVCLAHITEKLRLAKMKPPLIYEIVNAWIICLGFSMIWQRLQCLKYSELACE